MHLTLLSLLLFISGTQLATAQKVSQYLNQVVSYTVDKDNPPSKLHLSLYSSDVELQYVRGTRIMITGQVKLNISSIFFLETLISRGRYHLFLTPEGGTGLRLEDKVRQAIVLKGEQCKEEVSYILHIPETIQTVVFEDKSTGTTKVIHAKSRIE